MGTGSRAGRSLTDYKERDVTQLDDTLAPVFGGEPNLSLTQRGLYIAAGLGLAAAAARPRPNPLLSVAALVGGAYLALSGQQGRCPVKAALFDESERADVAFDRRALR
jgi:hypothetical protein